MTFETCRSCRADIEWATSAANGRPIPLDVGIVDDGNITTTVDLFGGELVATVVGVGSGDRVAHFVTCPQADSWRHHR